MCDGLWVCNGSFASGVGDVKITFNGAARTLGQVGARFTLSEEESELGFIEVCEQPIAMSRSSVSVRWADVGNLVLHDPDDHATVLTALLSVAADWLLLAPGHLRSSPVGSLTIGQR
jgi:hypothetical protein